MKRFVLIPFLCMLISCIVPCGPVGLYIQVVPEFEEEFVDTVDVSFENIKIATKTTPIPPIIKKDKFTYEKELNCYYGVAYEEYNCKNTNIRILDWSSIQGIIDNYVIKISDPSDEYEEYKTPTLKELIESNYKDRKLLDYDGKGNVLSPELTFKIQLTKIQNAGEVSTK